MVDVVVEGAAIVGCAMVMHAHASVSLQGATEAEEIHRSVSEHPVFAQAGALGIELERVGLGGDPIGNARKAAFVGAVASITANEFLATMSASDRGAAIKLALERAGADMGRIGIPAPATPMVLSGGLGTADQFIQLAMAQSGDRYVLGAMVDDNDPNPSVFDCAELVRWAAHQAGVDLQGDWSWTGSQFSQLQRQGATISVDQALRTPGALLFRDPGSTNGHVAISLGDGRVIEARGKDWGVGVWSATGGRRWTSGALIPGLTY